MDHSDKGDPTVSLPAASDDAVDGTRQQSEPGVEAPDRTVDGDDSAPDPERLKKINDLKQAVADGTYHVSAEEVARKIIEHMLEPKG
jgi:anti-sigma28 factor (negative regulator of flagellin synthesis)